MCVCVLISHLIFLQCLVNGLSFNKLHQDAPECKKLEMFFSGFPRMVGLYLFPNLQSLCIMGQSITRLEGLSPLTQLKELWVSECQVQVIQKYFYNYFVLVYTISIVLCSEYINYMYLMVELYVIVQ